MGGNAPLLRLALKCKGGKGKGGMKGGSKVVVEQHRHAGVFIARAKEDALCTLNSTPGKDVYGEKRISVDPRVSVGARSGRARPPCPFETARPPLTVRRGLGRWTARPTGTARPGPKSSTAFGTLSGPRSRRPSWAVSQTCELALACRVGRSLAVPDAFCLFARLCCLQALTTFTSAPAPKSCTWARPRARR